jgi:hypothetical protein
MHNSIYAYTSRDYNDKYYMQPSTVIDSYSKTLPETATLLCYACDRDAAAWWFFFFFPFLFWFFTANDGGCCYFLNMVYSSSVVSFRGCGKILSGICYAWPRQMHCCNRVGYSWDIDCNEFWGPQWDGCEDIVCADELAGRRGASRELEGCVRVGARLGLERVLQER